MRIAMQEKYKPRPEDIQWARTTLKRVKHGGMITMPGPGLVFTVDHKRKLLVLVLSLDPGDISGTYAKSVEVFGLLGWRLRKAV